MKFSQRKLCYQAGGKNWNNTSCMLIFGRIHITISVHAMNDFLELSLTLKQKPIIMENVAPSIKYIDFLGYVYSELGFFYPMLFISYMNCASLQSAN